MIRSCVCWLACSVFVEVDVQPTTELLNTGFNSEARERQVLYDLTYVESLKTSSLWRQKLKRLSGIKGRKFSHCGKKTQNFSLDGRISLRYL